MIQDVQDKLTKCLLLASSLTVFFLLAYAQYRESFGTDWYRHQSEYKRQLLARAGGERERQAAELFSIGQKHLYLPGLNRIDRCVTCHVSIDDPSMKDAAQPLTAHPGKFVQNHPMKNFGCTICHKGQGRATTAADAHGHDNHWTEPMLAREQIEQSCPKCHIERSLSDTARHNQARDLILRARVMASIE